MRFLNKYGPNDHINALNMMTYADKYKTHLSWSSSVNVKFPILGFFVIARLTTTGIANEFPNPALIAATVLNPSFVLQNRVVANPSANPTATCAVAASGSVHNSRNLSAVTDRLSDVHNKHGKKNVPLNLASDLASVASNHPRFRDTAPRAPTTKISDTARSDAKKICAATGDGMTTRKETKPTASVWFDEDATRPTRARSTARVQKCRLCFVSL
jgi:hypothetical protein